MTEVVLGDMLALDPPEEATLVYLDPPYNTGKNWGEFDDRWESMETYIGWMRERVEKLYGWLSEDGSFFLHVDPTASHYLKVMCDEIFGYSNFVNEIVWCYSPRVGGGRHFPRKHDVILFYRKDYKKGKFSAVWRPYDELETQRQFRNFRFFDDEGKRYRVNNWPSDIGERRMRWEDNRGYPVPSWWTDIGILKGHREKIGYPTQKPVGLVSRIVGCCTEKGDLVVDPMCGSGTALVAAQGLGRRWWGCDVQPGGGRCGSGEAGVKPKALSWLGAKTGGSRNPVGGWVAGMLPYGGSYVAPFAGMLGVLLQRRRSANEVVSDLDGRVANWWRVVGDPVLCGRLADRLALTPQLSEWVSDWARDNLDAEDPVDRALALVVNIKLQVNRFSVSNPVIRWQPSYGKYTEAPNPYSPDMLWALHNRIWGVQFHQRCGLEILEQTADIGNAVIYCDPPYRSSGAINEKYAAGVDYDRMSALLLGQQGMVAVSGRGDDWDHLGWERRELCYRPTIGYAYGGGESGKRTERLWMNYRPPDDRLF